MTMGTSGLVGCYHSLRCLECDHGIGASFERYRLTEVGIGEAGDGAFRDREVDDALQECRNEGGLLTEKQEGSFVQRGGHEVPLAGGVPTLGSSTIADLLVPLAGPGQSGPALATSRKIV